MKRIKVIPLVVALLLVLVAPICIPNTVTTVQAASVNISTSKLKLAAGKTKTLSIKGTKSKVTWSTSNKKVATVSKTGKVKAIAKGTAIIKGTVKINNKKTTFSCKVTVPKNTLVQAKLLNLTMTVPNNFDTEDLSETIGIPTLYFFPKGANLTNSHIALTAIATGQPPLDYADVKAVMEQMTAEALEEQLSTQMNLEVKINNFKQSDHTSKLGNYAKCTMSFTLMELTYNYNLYLISVDGYLIQVAALDVPGNATYDIAKLSEELLDSIKIN